MANFEERSVACCMSNIQPHGYDRYHYMASREIAEVEEYCRWRSGKFRPTWKSTVVAVLKTFLIRLSDASSGHWFICTYLMAALLSKL